MVWRHSIWKFHVAGLEWPTALEPRYRNRAKGVDHRGETYLAMYVPPSSSIAGSPTFVAHGTYAPEYCRSRERRTICCLGLQSPTSANCYYVKLALGWGKPRRAVRCSRAGRIYGGSHMNERAIAQGIIKEPQGFDATPLPLLLTNQSRVAKAGIWLSKNRMTKQFGGA